MIQHRSAIVVGIGILLVALAIAPRAAEAQVDMEDATVPDDQQAAGSTLLSPDDLRALVAPVALYPDELLAIVLPAATQPLQIVEAQRFLEQRKSDPNLQPDQNWDPAILALINYPDVVKKMNDDLGWTQQLGNAIMDQQKDVLDAIQAARVSASGAGYLQSTPQQTVTTENNTVVIKSADPEVIYVPQYDPAPVVENTYVNYPPPAYSEPYPYYSAPAATFFTGMFVGAAFAYGFDWDNDDIDIDCCNGGGNTNNNNINIGNGNTNINRDDLQNRFNGDRLNGGAQPKGAKAGNNKMKWSSQKARQKSSAPRTNAPRPTTSNIQKQLGGGGAAAGNQGGAGVRKHTPPAAKSASQTKAQSQRGNQSLGPNKQQRQQQYQNKSQQRQQQNRAPQQRQQQMKPRPSSGGAFGNMPSQRATKAQSSRGNRSMGGGGGGGRGGGNVPRRR
ncbi:MAG TPA: DUF3300 domain-containing protein [Candidatus Cybelea sp.]|nr:DUF3300 domain-containing protein [Candidatus Cybelea sp.]